MAGASKFDHALSGICALSRSIFRRKLRPLRYQREPLRPDRFSKETAGQRPAKEYPNFARSLETLYARQDVVVGAAVIEVRVRYRTCGENSRIEHAADDQRRPGFPTERHEFRAGGTIEQGIAAREQYAIQRRTRQHIYANLSFVYAEAVGGDDALGLPDCSSAFNPLSRSSRRCRRFASFPCV